MQYIAILLIDVLKLASAIIPDLVCVPTNAGSDL